jgi:hypothetical protein
MNTLNLIYLYLIQLVRQAWLLPQTVGSVLKLRRQRNLQNERKAEDELEREAERLDRIRHPSNYRLR